MSWGDHLRVACDPEPETPVAKRFPRSRRSSSTRPSGTVSFTRDRGARVDGHARAEERKDEALSLVTYLGSPVAKLRNLLDSLTDVGNSAASP